MRLTKYAVTVRNAAGVEKIVYPMATGPAAAIKKVEDKIAAAGTSWKVVGWRAV
jgi:hypothetical protein